MLNFETLAAAYLKAPKKPQKPQREPKRVLPKGTDHRKRKARGKGKYKATRCEKN